MDKYLLVILVFLVVTIPIAFIEPASGEFRDPPNFILMWAAIAGIIIIILYGGYRDRRDRRDANARRRKRARKP